MATGSTSVPVPIERGEHDEAAKEVPEPELLPLHVRGGYVPGAACSCRWTLRGERRGWLLTILTAYTALLLSLFAYGLLRDDGYGWAFLPPLIATLPWSFFAMLLIKTLGAGWFADNLFGNFVLIVAICGGLNELLAFVPATKALRSSTERIPSIHP